MLRKLAKLLFRTGEQKGGDFVDIWDK